MWGQKQANGHSIGKAACPKRQMLRGETTLRQEHGLKDGDHTGLLLLVEF